MSTTLVNDCSVSPQTLYLAFDLGQTHWNLAFTVGLGQSPREVGIVAGDLERLKREIAVAKRRLKLPDDAPVVSCYEAGRDGFWLHRWLEAHKVVNVVIDSSSIEVNRRQRRSKTDKIDARKLLTLLIRFHMTEEKVFSVVRVPSPAEEDDRHLHRELGTLTADETQLVNRIKGTLAALGVQLEPDRYFENRLPRLTQWNNEPLPCGVRRRVLADFAVLQAIRRQIRELERIQKAEIQEEVPSRATKQMRQMMSLKGIGMRCSSVYVKEFFAWRAFRSRRQAGGLTGLCPTPHQSGSVQHEHGISRAGNRWVRAIAVEMAWSWLHWQPESALSRWYIKRFHHGGPRLRKTGIVALARKLVIELWKFVETGTPPEGAILVEWEAKLKRGRCVPINPA